MRTIHQGHLPIRTLVLIGMVILITAQAYAQNANARLTIHCFNLSRKKPSAPKMIHIIRPKKIYEKTSNLFLDCLFDSSI